MESLQDKLTRVRRPRVQITYQVETEGAVVEKSLPFVVGVLGDFYGNDKEPTQALKDRKFIEIDRDNFNDVIKNFSPAVLYQVANLMEPGGSDLNVELTFQSMDDFEPINIISQIESLKNLLDTRNNLRDLATKVDRSDDLESILEQLLQNKPDLEAFSKNLSDTQNKQTSTGA